MYVKNYIYPEIFIDNGPFFGFSPITWPDPIYKRALQFFPLRLRMLYTMAESLTNSIVGAMITNTPLQKKKIPQRGNEIQRDLSELGFEQKRADLSKDILYLKNYVFKILDFKAIVTC